MSKAGHNRPEIEVDTSAVATKERFLADLEHFFRDQKNAGAGKRPWYWMAKRETRGGIRRCVRSAIKNQNQMAGQLADPMNPGMSRSCDACNNTGLCLFMTRYDDDHYNTTGQRWKVSARTLEALVDAAPPRRATQRKSDPQALLGQTR